MNPNKITITIPAGCELVVEREPAPVVTPAPEPAPAFKVGDTVEATRRPGFAGIVTDVDKFGLVGIRQTSPLFTGYADASEWRIPPHDLRPWTPGYGYLKSGERVPEPPEGYEMVPEGEAVRQGDFAFGFAFGGLERWGIKVTQFRVGQPAKASELVRAYARRKQPDPKAIAPGDNPDRLTNEQVGVSEGWRLLERDEIKERGKWHRDDRGRYLIELWQVDKWDDSGWEGCITGCTYRTRLSREELAALDKPKRKQSGRDAVTTAESGDGRPRSISLPVKDVRNEERTESGWRCDVTFGIPDDGSHDDPTITVTSDDVEKYPQPGDIMLVQPPHVCGYAEDGKAQS